MATDRGRTDESAIGAGNEKRSTLTDWLDRESPWLVVAASLLTYALLCAVLLVGAAIVAVYARVLLPGIIGVVAFFTIGIGLVAAAPTAARRLVVRGHDAFEARRKTDGNGRVETVGKPAERPRHVAQPPPTGSTDDRVLVVLDPDDPAGTLRAALQDIATAEVELHLLVVFPTAEYERRRRARIEAGVHGPYSVAHLEAEARRTAQRAGREYLDAEGTAFEAMGGVRRLRDRVRGAVEEHGYERVYVVPQRLSLLGRLLDRAGFPTALHRALPDPVTVEVAESVAGQATDDADSVSGVVSAVERDGRSHDT